MVMIDRSLIIEGIEIGQQGKAGPYQKRASSLSKSPPGSRLLNQEVGDQHRAWRDADLPAQ